MKGILIILITKFMNAVWTSAVAVWSLAPNGGKMCGTSHMDTL